MFRKSKTISLSTILLAVLLISICQFAYSQTTMGINQIAYLSIPYQFERAGMQGDSLALFHYSVTANVISISRAYVTPQGTLLPQEVIFTYVVNPEWGTLVTAPLAFEFKNGKLYSAFKTPTKLMVFFTDTSSTDTHVFDVTGLQFDGGFPYPNESFIIPNDVSGFLVHFYYDFPYYESKVYRFDFATDSLVTIIESPGRVYSLYPIGINHVLIAGSYWDNAPDYLLEGGSIVQTIAQPWYQYSYSYLRSTQQVCGDYYCLELDNSVDREVCIYQAIVYVENQELHYLLEPAEVGNRSLLGSSSYFASHSDSSFCGIYDQYEQTSPPNNPRFSSSTITSNHDVIPNAFPDLSQYNSAIGLITMDTDYIVAISGASPTCFTLVDYPNQRIRDFYFTLENGFGGNLYSSTRYLFYVNSTKAYVFHLELMAPVADEQLTPAPASISTYPNPFNRICNIEVKSPQNSFADIAVYNMKGQLVKTLYNGVISTSKSSYNWDGKDAANREVASGVYFIKMTTKTGTYAQRTLLLR